MDAWMRGRVDVCVCVGRWVYGRVCVCWCVLVCVGVCGGVWVCGCVDAWMSDCVDLRTLEPEDPIVFGAVACGPMTLRQCWGSESPQKFE